VVFLKVYQVPMVILSAERIYADSQYYRQQQLFLGEIKKTKAR